MRTTVINYQEGEVYLRDNDPELGLDYQELIPVDEFMSTFNLDFTQFVAITFEPERGLFTIEKPGGILEGYPDAESNPFLKNLASKKEQILDHYHKRFLDNRLPKFHVRMGKNVVLPDENALAYEAYQIEKEAAGFLRDTDFMVLRALETGEDLDPEIAEVRQEARDYLGAKLKERELKDASLKASSGSEAKIQAGLEKPVIDRFRFRKKNLK